MTASSHPDPLVFLDLDGVVDSFAFYKRQYKQRLVDPTLPLLHTDPAKILLLNELFLKIRARVIITSTRREGRSPEDFRREFLGLGGKFNIVGQTRSSLYYSPLATRGDEIDEYLKGEIDIDNYVVIDDDYWQRMENRHLNHFIKIDSHTGITKVNCNSIQRFVTVRYRELLRS